jgi:GntR family transcriptional regulator
VLPFQLALTPGVPVSDQVVYAVTKAIVAGRLRPGDEFPSVRALSQELRINPNTAQRIVSTLVTQGLLDVHPGIGTRVSATRTPTRHERQALLRTDVEALVVEAKRLHFELDDLLDAVKSHWHALERPKARS